MLLVLVSTPEYSFASAEYSYLFLVVLRARTAAITPYVTRKPAQFCYDSTGTRPGRRRDAPRQRR